MHFCTCMFPQQKKTKEKYIDAISHLSIADAATRVRSDMDMTCVATPTHTCASVCLPSCLLL